MQIIYSLRFFLTSLLLIVSSFAFAAGTVGEEAIPFTQDGDGHILFKAMVNGVTGNFMFDTGAGLNVFSKSFFEKLPDIKPTDGIFTGFRATGDRVDMKLYYGKELRIGKNRFPLSALSHIDGELGPIDGIISLKNFTNDVIITVDYTASVLRFEPRANFSALKKRAKAIIPIQLQDDRDISLDIFCRVRISDTLTLQFCLDSGAGTKALRINQAFMKYLPIDTADTAHVRKITHASEFKKGYISKIFIANIDHLAFADAPSIDVHNPRAQFVEDLIYDGIMSTAWLGKKITFDIPDKEILVQ